MTAELKNSSIKVIENFIPPDPLQHSRFSRLNYRLGGGHYIILSQGMCIVSRLFGSKSILHISILFAYRKKDVRSQYLQST